MPAHFSQPPFVALVDPSAQSDLVAIARAAPLIVRLADLPKVALPPQAEHWVLVDGQHSQQDVVSALDSGAAYAVTDDRALAQSLDADRVIVHAKSDAAPGSLAQNSASYAGAFVQLSAGQDATSIVRSVREALGKYKAIFTLFSTDATATEVLKTVQDLKSLGAAPCVSTSMISTTPSDASTVSLASLFISALRTDRTDGLFTTVVTSPSPAIPLGLVYSSEESIALSLVTGQATYYSRSRGGLWRKGETSGATQEVVRLRVDCDGDAVEFVVHQKRGTSFCHTEKATSCFGPVGGLGQLEQTLVDRHENAPAGSYTKRLFDDPQMLGAKIREEADELCRAETKEEVASEAADLLYFALVRDDSLSPAYKAHGMRRRLAVWRRGFRSRTSLTSSTAAQAK
jgi:phosphoribosyl-ATP pyrophosphohydrolase/phosphoribosyl-AMP cyclohydrolase/histidinol dehydrogenase